MGDVPQLPDITEEELATFRRCHFVRRVFRPRDCYRSLEAPADILGFVKEWEERGHDLLEDTARFEVIEGGWNHEHCDVCWVRIVEGDSYWPNEEEDAGQVDLCENCYRRVRKLLQDEPGTTADGQRD